MGLRNWFQRTFGDAASAAASPASPATSKPLRSRRYESDDENDPFDKLYPHQILPKLRAWLRSPNRETRMWGSAFGFSNFIHEFPAFTSDAVGILIDALGSHHSDEPEAAEQALAHVSVYCPQSLPLIQEAVLGKNIFGEDVEKIELYRHYDPEIRRYLACAMASAAIDSRHVAEVILDDLLEGFGGFEEEMHCALASELYQIADAHGGQIAWRVYCRLKEQAEQEPFEQARNEIIIHIQGLEHKHPDFRPIYDSPGSNIDRGVA